MKVKLFADDPGTLERTINRWLREEPARVKVERNEVIEIAVRHVATPTSSYGPMVMIFYEEVSE